MDLFDTLGASAVSLQPYKLSYIPCFAPAERWVADFDNQLAISGWHLWIGQRYILPELPYLRA